MIGHTSTHVPLVSIVIPTFNEEDNIRQCFERIRAQTYLHDKIEIIVVDDHSTDETVTIARTCGAVIFYSGFRNIERSKSIGIAHARGAFILFIDADVFFVETDWIATAIQILLDHPNVIGVQGIYWQYRKDHSPCNRYCELFGVNDPFVFYVGKRGILAEFEKEWMVPEAIVKETPDYFIARFTPETVPTLGSQGYLARTALLRSETHWQPYFFHLDAVYELVEKGHQDVALMKRSVEHDYVLSIAHFYKKLTRNLTLFLQFRHLRRYTYGIGSRQFFSALFFMLTIIHPLWCSIKGFFKKRDIAWFLHPVFCFTVPFLYTFLVLQWGIQSVLWKKDLKV